MEYHCPSHIQQPLATSPHNSVRSQSHSNSMHLSDNNHIGVPCVTCDPNNFLLFMHCVHLFQHITYKCCSKAVVRVVWTILSNLL